MSGGDLQSTRRQMDKNLIAPCGMNCGVCRGYLAYSRNIPKLRGKVIHCSGCRERNKHCAYLKGRCVQLTEHKINYCFECEEFPCERLEKLDERYRRKQWDVSFTGNLMEIKDKGINEFLKHQEEKHRCPKCGGVISVHDKKCYDCMSVMSNPTTSEWLV
jgi:hypothetical protein